MNDVFIGTLDCSDDVNVLSFFRTVCISLTTHITLPSSPYSPIPRFPTSPKLKMFHQTVNCILVIVLIILFLVCCCYTPSTFGGNAQHYNGNEPFFDYRLSNAMGPFCPSATPPYEVNVGSAYPPQRKDNSSWTFATPFQSACSSGPNPDQCRPCDTFTCYLTPHNQRKCRWGSTDVFDNGDQGGVQVAS